MAKTRKPLPPPVENPSPARRRKKKGRPSLLDLQRRSLRLQAQNPCPAPSQARRSRHLSDEEEEGSGGGRRREKRLKSVLSAGGEQEEEEANDAAKATGKAGDAASDCGPTGTPLADKKLLLFILDRLQKKDTYGVFSEPVDPEELPDYHEIVEHPIDFLTIREKLSNGAYANLEDFEKDVFLLTSNAMSYNAPDTIYYRQARSIEALAKKDFENLRQASDDDEEQEPKTVGRRGRPPKNTKKTVDKIDDDVSPDLSSVKTNKSEDNTETIRKRSTGDRTRSTNISTRDTSILHQNALGFFCDKRTDKSGSYSGPSKYVKKTTSLDESRRNTFDQLHSRDHPFAALDGERKLLVPVGLQQEHAYARSLARFAAQLGPIGWDIAARSIRRVLPPGTSFGPGWVVDGEPHQNSHHPPVSTFTHPSSQPNIRPCNMTSKNDELPQKSRPSSNGDATGEEHIPRTVPLASTSAGFGKTSDFAGEVPKLENGVRMSCDGADNIGPMYPFQQHGRSPEIRSNMNGFSALPSTINQYAGKGFFGSDMQMTHAQVLGMVSGVNGRTNGYIHGHPLVAEGAQTALNGDVRNTNNPLPDAGHDPQGALPLNKIGPGPPSLNFGAQAPGSPPAGKVADTKHPDLALQL